MKKLVLIDDTMAHKITYYHLLVFVMSLPFDRLYSELTLISLCIHTLIHFRKTAGSPFHFSKLLLPVSVYLLTIIGTLYTNYKEEAFYEWERQLAMLLLPLIFFFNDFDFKKYRLQVLMGLAFSCFVTIVCLYAHAFMLIRENHLSVLSFFNNAFINHNFAAPIQMHATYFSMYIALAMVAGVYCLFHAVNKRDRFMYVLLCMVLLAGLLQLSSKAVLIAFAFIGNIILPLFFLSGKKRVVCMVATCLFSVLIFLGLTRVGDLKARFIIGLQEDLTQTGINNKQIEPRIVRWEAAWELIKQSPVYGHGSGSEVALLKEAYYQRKLYNSYLHELNVHNQYLSMWLKTGILGLLVLLYVFYAGFRTAVKNRDLLFGCFLIIIATVSFSENMLDANKGIFYFSFFFSLFYLFGANGKSFTAQK